MIGKQGNGDTQRQPAPGAPPGALPGTLPGLGADVIAGFQVFLIALPLCLGIALASGFPPAAGILTAVVGGLVSPFISNSELTIKGPAAGLIVVVLGSVQALGDGDPLLGYQRTLAVGVVAGLIQTLLGLLRLGRIVDLFPTAAVHGMLAAIGVIVISRQVHVALGVKPDAAGPLGLLMEIPHSLLNLNPAITLIGGVSLAVVFILPVLRQRLISALPAPIVVVAIAIVLGLYFGLTQPQTYVFLGHEYALGPHQLVPLPSSLLQAVQFPDFSGLWHPQAPVWILMFAVIGSVESLLSAKAVDLIDPRHRRCDLNADLTAVGVGNTIAALLGGLPMISEIVRSSANVGAGARSRWANFFHGLFLLAMVAALPGLLSLIPLAALAALLIHTGLRLASPREFLHMRALGGDQFAVFLTTLIVTLASDLLIGIASGLVLQILLHLADGADRRHLHRARVRVDMSNKGHPVIRVRGSALFSNWGGLRRHIDDCAQAPIASVDLSATRVVDHTTMQRLHELQAEWQRAGRVLMIVGLTEHHAWSPHPQAGRRRLHDRARRRGSRDSGAAGLTLVLVLVGAAGGAPWPVAAREGVEDHPPARAVSSIARRPARAHRFIGSDGNPGASRWRRSAGRPSGGGPAGRGPAGPSRPA